MERVSINDLYRSNGQINLFGWLFFFATLLALGYTAYQAHCNIQRMKTDEKLLKTEIKILKDENAAMKNDIIRIKEILKIY